MINVTNIDGHDVQPQQRAVVVVQPSGTPSPRSVWVPTHSRFAMVVLDEHGKRVDTVQADTWADLNRAWKDHESGSKTRKPQLQEELGTLHWYWLRQAAQGDVAAEWLSDRKLSPKHKALLGLCERKLLEVTRMGGTTGKDGKTTVEARITDAGRELVKKESGL